MKYIVTHINRRNTRAGKPFASASLMDENGQVLEKVSVWSDFPGFDKLTMGAVVLGKVEVNGNGYKNLKISNGNDGVVAESDTENTFAYDANNLQVVKSKNPEEYRSELIRVAQSRKNDSIAYFNATNAAISLISSLQPKLITNFNRSTLKHEIDYWREWFLHEWKKHDVTVQNRSYAA
jgi:hypothetical protein